MALGLPMRVVVIGLGLLMALPASTPAEEGVPAEIQAAIMTRMLNYDRALRSRANATLVVGILAKARDKSSIQAQSELANALLAFQPERIQGLPVSVVTAQYTDDEHLAAWLAQAGILVLYVGPGLSSEVEAIQGACVARKAMSLTPVRSYVERGLVAGIVLKDARPGILVNLPVAIATGLDLDPKLLALSEVIR